MRKIELLAPSGDWDSFVTAINNGCDAVYLGLGEFNARAKSTFFTLDNIRATVEYAHLFGVKVNVTINTLVRDDEFADFLKLVDACVEAKVDCYIVQDLGVASILRQLYPNIELHASTQMGIHNLDGAKIAESLGFKRIVLSREVKEEDIKEIKQNTNLEVEYFIQGALCVAFSGNCYFSALEYDNSGNRGKCMQPCRFPYTAFIGDKNIGSGYLLSARDLCLMPNIEKLYSLGIDSFKIEGRLRRPGYVGQSVNSYRKALDNIDFSKKAEIEKLEQVFSRGQFNHEAYLSSGVPDNIINKTIQNHLGKKIGTILDVARFKDLYKVKIQSSHPIASGDGLKFLDENDIEIASLGVGNVEKQNNTYTIYTKHNLRRNLQVYLTLNKKLEDDVMNNKKYINLDLNFVAEVDKPFYITIQANDKKATKVAYTSEYINSPALSSPTQSTEIEDLFFTLDIETFKVNTTSKLDNVFIPKSALKEARRTLASLVKQQIISNYEAEMQKVEKTTLKNSIFDKNIQLKPSFTSIYVIDEDLQFNNAEITDDTLIVLEPMVYSEKNILDTIAKLSKSFKNIGLVLPTIANHLDIAILDSTISKLDKSIYLVANNLYGLKYADTHKIVAGLDMNVYNKYTVAKLLSLGVTEFIWSKETPTQVEGCYEFCKGHHKLMHFAHCPIKTLFDNNCSNCKYASGIKLLGNDGKAYFIKRTIISQCYFTLYSNKYTQKDKKLKFIDLRN